MQILSTEFKHQQQIPKKFTCDGENTNPPLTFIDVPTKAISLVLIMDDPDVPTHIRPNGNWDHWLIWNIPPNTIGVEENTLPPGIVGINTRGTNKYIGPCPPDKQHRYFFKLYALDTKLDIPPTTTKIDLLEKMSGHILEQAELIGLYKRN
ncbi:MAG: YbhB/YbcL family Raf kinase inhibitor-like protein [Patescibacteria group bacterium]